MHGDVDMYEVVKAIVEEEHRRKAEGSDDLIPMRPDHGHQMLDDLKKKNESGLFRHWPSERACGSPRR
ncbi:mannonate dehydratase [Salmonella enterica subsp. enterica]|uniref:Mannonate dehydratase n=1 Tax=Salmonella enterica I TaxID=59201 RepID=A0A3S4IPZ0_SALET|nr:mannonate dehydratase [Salmonella enterica subsp. enterica]